MKPHTARRCGLGWASGAARRAASGDYTRWRLRPAPLAPNAAERGLFGFVITASVVPDSLVVEEPQVGMRRKLVNLRIDGRRSHPRRAGGLGLRQIVRGSRALAASAVPSEELSPLCREVLLSPGTTSSDDSRRWRVGSAQATGAPGEFGETTPPPPGGCLA